MFETKALSSRFKEARRSTLIQDLLYKVADGDVSLDVAKSFIKSLGER
jgi:hypothetical protein